LVKHERVKHARQHCELDGKDHQAVEQVVALGLWPDHEILLGFNCVAQHCHAVEVFFEVRELLVGHFGPPALEVVVV